MKKKILALLLAVVMLVGVMPLSAIEYNPDPDGDGEKFVLKASDATITKSDTTVDVDIDIIENTGVYAMKYYVIYDKELTLVSNDNVTKGTAFADFLVSDVGSKDMTDDWMSEEDIDWDWMLDNYYQDYGWTLENPDDVLITTVYSECVNWYDSSTDIGTICTFTFQIDPNNTKDEFTVQILPVYGNTIRDDPDHPLADDEGIVEIFDPIGLPGIITIEGGEGGEIIPQPPVYTDPTIYISNAEIVVGTESADFTLNLVNNPGLYCLYGFVGYDEAMSLTGFEFGTVFAESEFVLGNPIDVPSQLNLPSDAALIQAAYASQGVSPDGLLSTQVYVEGSSFMNNNVNNGVLATFTLNTASLGVGEYDIIFVYDQDGTSNVDFDNVEFDVVYGKLTVTDGPACEHDWVAGEAVAPTCTEDGYTPYECSICGETKQDNVVSKLGHDYDAVVTPPTCTAEGYTTYTCKNGCGQSYVDDYTDMIDHDYDAVVTEPTCTEGGYTTYTCSACGDNYVADETEATGHSWTVTGTSGTCGEVGKTDYTCTVCGETKTEEGAVIEHNYVKVGGTEPTCTEDGEVLLECTICGDDKAEVVPSPGHDYEAVVTDPTCTEDGYTTYTCSVCGDSYVGNVVATPGHNYVGEVTDEPECEDTGVEHFVCSVCGDNYDMEIPALGHDYEAVVTPPTCEAGGYTTYTCKNDATHTYVDDEVAALGHDYEGVVTPPTCTEDGYTTYTCKNDATHTYVDDEVAALGHDYEGVVTPPTCTEDGYTTYTCKNDATHTYVDDEVAALGHDYEAVVTDPTCTEKGFTTHTCSVCGDNYVDAFVDALGHDLEESDVVEPTCTENGSKHVACTRCDYEADEVIEAPGHVWDDGEVTKEPTVDAEGEKTYTCEVCGEKMVEKLEKLPAEEKEEDKEETKEESKEESKEEDKSHQTGDGMMMFVFVALIAVVCAAGVMFSRKRLFARK